MQALCQDAGSFQRGCCPSCDLLFPRYEAIWLKWGVEMVLAWFPSRVLNFEDELLCIWKWFLFLRLESWKVLQMLYCFHVCWCRFRTDMEIMLVCLLSLFSKHRVLCSLFSVVLRKPRRATDESVGTRDCFLPKLTIHYRREAYGNICLSVLTKPNPFMAPIFGGKKIKKGEVYSFN